MKTAIILFALTLSQPPKTIQLTNIYTTFTPSKIDSVNIAAIKNDSYYITRNGKLYGIYPKNEFSLKIVGE